MPLPGNISNATRRLNPGVFRTTALNPNNNMVSLPGGKTMPLKELLAGEKPRLRQNRKGPNKLEAEFEAWLREEWREVHGAEVHPQGVTFFLANGVRYTPDFALVTPHGGLAVRLFETKGFMRDDAAVKIKVAARTYRQFEFHLVTKRKKKDGDGWSIERVLP